jgi:choline-sulfatase
MNVLYILADQHNPSFSGCYGGITRTPNLDALAAGGVRFANAYTNYPLCVPSRASMITSRYAHEMMFWDNTVPYDGKLPGWGHYFRQRHTKLTTIGKLDMAMDADVGIDDIRNRKHRKGLNVTPLFRDTPVFPMESFKHVIFQGKEDIVTKEQESEADITEEAIRWLKEERPDDQSWVLNVNFHRPHPKWIPHRAQLEYYRSRIGKLKGKYALKLNDLHEVDQALSVFTGGYDVDGGQIELCHAAYHAMIEDVDDSIGRLIRTLDELGIRDEVMIVYTSDHGEMAGAHGKWGKVSLHEDSIRVPLILCGPGLPAGEAVDHPVSLIDVYTTINEMLGHDAAPFSRGRSLLRLARTGRDDERIDYIFSESHAASVIAGAFAIRKGDWKLIEYVGYRSSLFNLREDPDEMHDYMAAAAGDTALTTEAAGKIAELRAILRSVCLPEGIDQLARRQQRNLRKQLAASGQLYREQIKRGFEPNAEHLIPARRD